MLLLHLSQLIPMLTDKV